MKFEEIDESLFGKEVYLNVNPEEITINHGNKISPDSVSKAKVGGLKIGCFNSTNCVKDQQGDLKIFNKDGDSFYAHYSFVELKKNHMEETNTFDYSTAMVKLSEGVKLQRLSYEYKWVDVKEGNSIKVLKESKGFRVKEQKVLLEKKEYTKQQLLDIVGGMK